MGEGLSCSGILKLMGFLSNHVIFLSDPNRTKGSVVQLKRPGTSATWSGTRGGQQAQRGK